MALQMSAITSSETTANGEAAGNWSLRPYREGDARGIAALANAAFAADKRDKVMSVEEMERSLAMPLSDPPRQVIIADGPRVEGVPEGMPIGYGRILALH